MWIEDTRKKCEWHLVGISGDILRLFPSISLLVSPFNAVLDSGCRGPPCRRVPVTIRLSPNLYITEHFHTAAPAQLKLTPRLDSIPAAAPSSTTCALHVALALPPPPPPRALARVTPSLHEPPARQLRQEMRRGRQGRRQRRPA
jgi:hypothetical protein